MSTISRRSLMTAAVAAPAAAFLPAAEASASEKWDASCDVLIAGGGAAGCMAAVEAARAGKSVMLVQAIPALGGSSAISSGWIRACGTRWHKARNIKDTVEAYKEDILRYGNGCRLEKKAEVIASESGKFVDYLADIGVTFTDEEDRANGGATLRIVKTAGGGNALMQKLGEAVEKTKGVTVRKRTRIVKVLLDAKGERVVGAVIAVRNKEQRVRANAVILATGGYGRNQELVERFTNGWAKTGRIMDLEDKGDGLIIATDLGAGTANLNIAMVCPTLEVTKNIFYSSAPILNGAIFVNEKGRRFTNEYVIYTQTNIDMLRQKTTWEIVTPELHPVVGKMIEQGVAHKCDTVEDLAKLIGCPVDGLKADIEDHNATTRLPAEKRHDRFGRVVYGKELKAPFYALQVKPVMIETVGGITINEKSEVTTLLGRPIAKGLYAAGALAFGEHFGTGYRSGEAYVYAGVTGMVAGREAAKL
ncbi:FAD-dependent oxidoreductase [uncultured Sutterella sp.]|uniref:FAD-dependent oxidoreductase n=1 Tax=uncultured Sutterella sp. TaxID=286133 RepID=UPI002607E219|nr:FAD-dependent oxidoreductase [uncultured Sutterella sp.]